MTIRSLTKEMEEGGPKEILVNHPKEIRSLLLQKALGGEPKEIISKSSKERGSPIFCLVFTPLSRNPAV
jgi:hypothetical protein